MSYQIKLKVFEGPFDLLFHLIQKNEVNIYDIPIAEITDQYINYIHQLQENNLEVMSEFIVMAAHLLEIKSKMLLPKSKNDEETETDPRTDLVEQLLQYKRFKEFSSILKEREKEADKIAYKLPEIIENYLSEEHFDTDPVLEGLSLNDIFQAFKRVLERNEKKIDKIRSKFQSVSRDLYTVEEKMEWLFWRINEKKSMIFSDLFYEDASRVEIIITFLALLELIKLKKVNIKQNNSFSDIMIEIW